MSFWINDLNSSYNWKVIKQFVEKNVKLILSIGFHHPSKFSSNCVSYENILIEYPSFSSHP